MPKTFLKCKLTRLHWIARNVVTWTALAKKSVSHKKKQRKAKQKERNLGRRLGGGGRDHRNHQEDINVGGWQKLLK